MVRAVVDTNVTISAALCAGTSRKIWLSFQEGKISLIFSSSMLEELTRTFRKPKIAKLINEDEAKKMLLFIELFAEFVEPSKEILLCRDPADNHIIATALAAKANFIISGDDDLLSLKSPPISIITPKKFVEYLK